MTRKPNYVVTLAAVLPRDPGRSLSSNAVSQLSLSCWLQFTCTATSARSARATHAQPLLFPPSASQANSAPSFPRDTSLLTHTEHSSQAPEGPTEPGHEVGIPSAPSVWIHLLQTTKAS